MGLAAVLFPYPEYFAEQNTLPLLFRGDLEEYFLKVLQNPLVLAAGRTIIAASICDCTIIKY